MKPSMPPSARYRAWLDEIQLRPRPIPVMSNGRPHETPFARAPKDSERSAAHEQADVLGDELLQVDADPDLDVVLANPAEIRRARVL